MQETWVRSLGQEDPLEKGMTTHSSVLARRIQWTEEPGRLQSMGLQRVRHDWTTNILSSQNFSSLNMHAFFIPSWLWTYIFFPWKSPCYDSCQILNKQNKKLLKTQSTSNFFCEACHSCPDNNPFLRYSSTIRVFIAICYHQILVFSLPLSFTYYNFYSVQDTKTFSFQGMVQCTCSVRFL